MRNKTEQGFSPDQNEDMSYVKIMIHAVWGTKSSEPFLTGEIRPLVISHIKDNAKAKGIYIDALDGYFDHLHCLFGLNSDMAVTKAIQLFKGESAYWINKGKLTRTKFEWADEYFAVSISESMLPKSREYIHNQELHHKKKTFMQEYEEFLRLYGFEGQG